MARVLDFDPVNLKVQHFHFNHADDSFTIEDKQDVTACVELTRAEYAAMDERAPWKQFMNRVARIPMITVGKLMRDGVWYDDHALRKWLDDRDNLKYRTRSGKLSR